MNTIMILLKVDVVLNRLYVKVGVSSSQELEIKNHSYRQFLDDYIAGHCKCDSANNCASMGYNADQGDVHGDFYLHTNKVEPYCQN